MDPLFEPPAVLLAVDVAFAHGTAKVVLSGELDRFTVPELSEQLDRVLDKNPDSLVFDMRAVTFIDVGAARMLAGTGRRLPGGAKPVIRKPSVPVRKLLRVARFDAAFRLEELPPGQLISKEEPQMAAVTPRADWWKRAACQNADPELFFPISEEGQSWADITRAVRVCMGCPVRAQCLEYALSTQQKHGIWGGTTENERRRLIRRRAA